ncbi:GDSL-type esterase/lipase family protein [Citrobacter meridianamericanus]|uniref:GDSL-type esterase/lipase family protein n=1 Tax=Citrobacter meridianamericanus TaxID=2894201 RepID=A0ABT1B7F7_9ENTR|nr:GDSL-type esterase/lipase family protein [Citrobacter meridianamericanus]MCO5781823.1 GDSL-type esterase/lipase family protein [Citrobacter meridianamericanus]
MTTTPTQNAVPSESPVDLKFNAGKIDEFVTSMAKQYIDRFGHEHYTIEGLKQLVMQQIYNLGWNLEGSFQDGGTVISAGDLLQDEITNIWYRWDDLETLPKTVPAGSTPSSAGGVGEGKWQAVDVSDVLRKELAAIGGATKIGAQNTEGELSNVQKELDARKSASYRDRCITKLADVDYKLRNSDSINILFQGDSMTAGYDMTTTDSVAPEGEDWARHATTIYPNRLASYLNEQSGVTVNSVIRAISGHTAKMAYEQAEWQTNPNCDLVLLMYGLNDAQGTAGATHDEYIEYMEKLIRRFIDWGMGVVVMSCANGGYGSTDKKAQSYARQIKNLASIYGCAHFNANETQYNRVFSSVQSDFGHFNSNGYARLGDEIASMMMAGGLMPNYRPISSETTMWPGISTDQVGYYNPQKNIDTLRYPSAYTLQGIAGGFPGNNFSIMSFSFYLDAEAAEVDIVGSWTPEVKIVFAMQQSTASQVGVNVTYYDHKTYSSNSSESVEGYTSGLTLNNANTASGCPKHLGVLSGKGWKTITIYTPQDGSGDIGGYIQQITVRPTPRYFTSRETNGSLRRGVKEVVMLNIPSRDFSTSGTPPPQTLTSFIVPLPYDLNPISWSGDYVYYDCGFSKIEISGVQAGFGIVYYEGLLSKDAAGSGITVTELKKIGEWPALTAAIGTKAIVIKTPKYSLGTDMPLEDILGIGDDSTFVSTSTPNKFGLFLKITLPWSGTPPTGFYTVSLESGTRGLGGASSVATLTP